MFVHLLQLGRIPYAEGLEIQSRVVAARKAGAIGDTLLLLEHPPVITLGRNSSRANVLVNDDWLAAHGVELHEINRGGDVTYHGPGQLIGYPIVDLRGDWPGKKGPHLGPVDFVRMIEEALIRTCADFGVMAKRIPKCTGVWTFGGGDDDAQRSGLSGRKEKKLESKLAAIGVHVSQGVTSHGFALNVTTDLRDFEWIIPCGITDRGVTSLEVEADPSSEPTMERAINSAARNFGRVFGRQMVWSESLDQLLAAPADRPRDGKRLDDTARLARGSRPAKHPINRKTYNHRASSCTRCAVNGKESNAD
jgi:lipoyl(octanoyl) transferase